MLEQLCGWMRAYVLVSQADLSHAQQSISWSNAGAQVFMTTRDKEATVHREVRDTSEDWKPIKVSHSDRKKHNKNQKLKQKNS